MRMIALCVCLVLFAGLGLAFAAEEAPPADEHAAAEAVQGHPFCWIEFGSSDTAATAAFLTTVFGWQMQDFPAMPGYTFFMPAKGLMGGLSPVAADKPVHTTPYVFVPDIAAALVQIAAAGGKKISDPEEIPDTGGGKIAMFSDPAGVTYGLADMAMPDPYTPKPIGEAAGADEVPAAGTIVSLELYGGDFKQTAEFFQQQFQWTTRGVGENYMEFAPGTGVSGVFQNHTPQAPVLAYIWSDDIAATVAAIEAAGGTLLADVISSAEMGVSMAYFTAPGGVVLGLISPLAQDAG